VAHCRPIKAHNTQRTTQDDSKAYLQTRIAQKSGSCVVLGLQELDMQTAWVTFRLVAHFTLSLQKSHKHGESGCYGPPINKRVTTSELRGRGQSETFVVHEKGRHSLLNPTKPVRACVRATPFALPKRTPVERRAPGSCGPLYTNPLSTRRCFTMSKDDKVLGHPRARCHMPQPWAA